MKTFKQLVSEVAQPKPEEEKRFKDQHEIQLFDYPSPDSEFIFKGTTNKQMRLADQEGSDAYDAAYVKKEVQEESFDLTENPMEEKPMMMGTLKAMSHYIQGIARYVNSTQDPEEWFQNKLAGASKEMQTLYAYATSEMMVMGESADDLHEAKTLKGDEIVSRAGVGRGQLDISKFLRKAVGAKKGDFANMIYFDGGDLVRGDKTVVKNALSNKSMTVNDLLAALKKHMGEAVEMTEAVKPGNLKLKDGSMVRVSKQDAQLLNDLLGDLNPKNRKEMEKVMMTDTAGYDEILGFAREAL